MIDTTDFKFRDDLYNVDKGETVPIEILMGPYKGVILRYTQVSIKEQDNGTAVLQFTYELLTLAEQTETTLRKDSRFEHHIGLLLNHLILEATQGIDDNADREDYSEDTTDR
jgi:hypothetical protein